MNWKQLLHLVIVLVLIAVFGFALRWWQDRATTSAGAETGDAVFPEFPLNDIARVEVLDAEQSCILAKKEGTWKVVSRHDYPADFGQLRTFLVNLSNLTIAHTVAAAPSQYGRLSLETPAALPGQAGTEVLLQDDQENLIRRVILGKLHRSESPHGGPGWPDGRYIRIPKEGTDDLVALVTETFEAVTADATEWLDDSFIEVRDVVSASLRENEEAQWMVTRDEPSGEFSLLGFTPTDTKTADTSAMRSAATAFSYARFEDIADPALPPQDTGLDAGKVYSATTADGIVYTLSIGTKTEEGNYYVTVGVGYEAPPEAVGRSENDDAADGGNGVSPEDAEDEPSQADLREQARDLHERFSPWTYLIRGSTIENVLKPRSDFVKEEEKPESDESNQEDDAPGDESGDQAGGTE
ncbi:MAG: DUF4340 domain-containing protein [Candidatus Pacebacteria bacterium]|nr:DUF4340 domain-containing protein [Candidatus Paceibacterota bacterium]